jgi:hypothetical protein
MNTRRTDTTCYCRSAGIWLLIGILTELKNYILESYLKSSLEHHSSWKVKANPAIPSDLQFSDRECQSFCPKFENTSLYIQTIVKKYSYFFAAILGHLIILLLSWINGPCHLCLNRKNLTAELWSENLPLRSDICLQRIVSVVGSTKVCSTAIFSQFKRCFAIIWGKKHTSAQSKSTLRSFKKLSICTYYSNCGLMRSLFKRITYTLV